MDYWTFVLERYCFSKLDRLLMGMYGLGKSQKCMKQSCSPNNLKNAALKQNEYAETDYAGE